MSRFQFHPGLPALLLAATVGWLQPTAVNAQEISSPFHGGAVPSGTVKHERDETRHVLVLSSDFSIHEEPPDPHWRVIDSNGNVFLLDKLKVQGRVNSRITLPSYITSVAKVEMWCAFAEIVLGEAEFAHPVVLK